MPTPPTLAPIARALSVRQPWAELILRGEKPAEYRRRPTRVVGERFFLYAAKRPGPAEIFDAMDLAPADLPTGLLVGTAIIAACRPATAAEWPAGLGAGDEPGWAWVLTDVRRLPAPIPPDRHPQPTWFRPFRAAREVRRDRAA